MWPHPVSVKENVQTYISPKLCLTPEIKSKYFRTSECVGIGQTTVYYVQNLFEFNNSALNSSVCVLILIIMMMIIIKIPSAECRYSKEILFMYSAV